MWVLLLARSIFIYVVVCDDVENLCQQSNILLVLDQGEKEL